MKRYRILSFDFDSRAMSLTGEIQDQWEEHVKASHRAERERTVAGLIREFGEAAAQVKVQNFADLGPKLSILAFHNKFFQQIRHSFVIGGYFPALTGACALGERILNHLVLLLRDDFKASPAYKQVYRKDSFDRWEKAIRALDSWSVLLPHAVDKFRQLERVRNRAIHFDPVTDREDRPLALNAIKLLSDIISSQFSAFGRQPWFLSVPGEMYIKKSAESEPFVRRVYLPNCRLLGPYHIVEEITPDLRMLIRDDYRYQDREVSDEEFVKLRQGHKPTD